MPVSIQLGICILTLFLAERYLPSPWDTFAMIGVIAAFGIVLMSFIIRTRQ